MPYFGLKINISPVLFSGKHGSKDLDKDSEEEYESPQQPIDIICWDAIKRTTPSYCIGSKTYEIGTTASHKKHFYETLC